MVKLRMFLFLLVCVYSTNAENKTATNGTSSASVKLNEIHIDADANNNEDNKEQMTENQYEDKLDIDNILPDQEKLLTPTEATGLSNKTQPESSSSELSSTLEPSDNVDFPPMQPPNPDSASQPTLINSVQLRTLNINSSNRAQVKDKQKVNTKLEVSKGKSIIEYKSIIDSIKQNKTTPSHIGQEKKKYFRRKRKRTHSYWPYRKLSSKINSRYPPPPPLEDLTQYPPGADPWSYRSPEPLKDPYSMNYDYDRSFQDGFNPYYDQYARRYHIRLSQGIRYGPSPQYDDQYPTDDVNPPSFPNVFDPDDYESQTYSPYLYSGNNYGFYNG